MSSRFKSLVPSIVLAFGIIAATMISVTMAESGWLVLLGPIAMAGTIALAGVLARQAGKRQAGPAVLLLGGSAILAGVITAHATHALVPFLDFSLAFFVIAWNIAVHPIIWISQTSEGVCDREF